MKSVALTVFQGRAGDHNDLAIPGAASIGSMLSDQLGLTSTIIGTPERALNTGWKSELAAAMPALQELSAHYDAIFEDGAAPLTALTRCAVALATLPALAKHRPDACLVWLDAHADLNTPETSTTGYLGGMAISGAAGRWNSGLGGGLNLANVILVGLRDIDPGEQVLIDTAKVRTIAPQEGLGQQGLGLILKQAIAGRPSYVHLDCDILNSGIVPTDYQIDGGLSLADLHAVLEVIAEGDVVGLEIAEFQNSWSTDGPPVSPRELLDAVQPLIERLTRKS